MSFIGGALFGGASAYQQDKAQAAADRANAAAATAQGKQVLNQLGVAQQNNTLTGEKQLGAVRAAYAANGVSNTQGSAADVLAADQAVIARRAQNLNNTGIFQANQLFGEAAGYLTQAKYAENASGWAALTGVAGSYGGIASTFSGFGSQGGTPSEEDATQNFEKYGMGTGGQ